MASLIKNLSSYEYFFEQLKYPNWLELLEEKGVYNIIPRYGERSIEPLFLLKIVKQKFIHYLETLGLQFFPRRRVIFGEFIFSCRHGGSIGVRIHGRVGLGGFPPPREEEPCATLVGPISITVGFNQLCFFLPRHNNALKQEEEYEGHEVLSKENPSDSKEEGCQMHWMPDVCIRSLFNEHSLAWESTVDVFLYEIRSPREQWQGDEHQDRSKQLERRCLREKPRPSRGIEDDPRGGEPVEGKSQRHDGRDAEHDGADDGRTISRPCAFPYSLCAAPRSLEATLPNE